MLRRVSFSMAGLGLLWFPFCATLGAQGLLLPHGAGVPPKLASTEGNADLHLPSRYAPSRVQMLYRGKDFGIPSTGKKLTALAFRRDGVRKTKFGAHSYKHTIQISGVGVPGPSMCDTGSFAANRGRDVVTVLGGKSISWPSLAVPVAPPAPFAIAIKLDKPYLMQSGTNLCIEIVTEAIGAAKGNHYWYVDAQSFDHAKKRGTVRHLGRGCPSTFQLRLDPVPLDGETAFTGYSLTRVQANKSLPVLLWLGAQTKSWGQLSLPIDLTGLGAAGCKIYLEPIMSFVSRTVPKDPQGYAAFQLGVLPKAASFQGITLYGQALVFDATANAMGVRSSGYEELKLGQVADPLPARTLYHSTSALVDKPSKAVDIGVILSLSLQ